MAEEMNNAAAENEAPENTAAEPILELQRCYFTDVSLEMPRVPEIFMQQMEEQPVVDIKFGVQFAPMPVPQVYEVRVRGTVTVKHKDSVLFLVEGVQAGLFVVANFPEEALEPVLNVHCPSIIYPYLRANIADLITRTTLPPVHLPEVNFQALYQQQVAQRQAQQTGAAPQAS